MDGTIFGMPEGELDLEAAFEKNRDEAHSIRTAGDALERIEHEFVYGLTYVVSPDDEEALERLERWLRCNGCSYDVRRVRDGVYAGHFMLGTILFGLEYHKAIDEGFVPIDVSQMHYSDFVQTVRNM